MKLNAILLMILISTLVGCMPGGDAVLYPGEFNSRIHATTQVQLVDVRTPKEYAEGHIEGAVNMNFNGDNFTQEIETLTKTMAVYLYCRSGKRSASAARQMGELGFKEVYDLDGGILAWEGGGLPVVK